MKRKRNLYNRIFPFQDVSTEKEIYKKKNRFYFLSTLAVLLNIFLSCAPSDRLYHKGSFQLTHIHNRVLLQKTKEIDKPYSLDKKVKKWQKKATLINKNSLTKTVSSPFIIKNTKNSFCDFEAAQGSVVRFSQGLYAVLSHDQSSDRISHKTSIKVTSGKLCLRKKTKNTRHPAEYFIITPHYILKAINYTGIINIKKSCISSTFLNGRIKIYSLRGILLNEFNTPISFVLKPSFQMTYNKKPNASEIFEAYEALSITEPALLRSSETAENLRNAESLYVKGKAALAENLYLKNRHYFIPLKQRPAFYYRMGKLTGKTSWYLKSVYSYDSLYSSESLLALYYIYAKKEKKEMAQAVYYKLKLNYPNSRAATLLNEPDFFTSLSSLKK